MQPRQLRLQMQSCQIIAVGRMLWRMHKSIVQASVACAYQEARVGRAHEFRWSSHVLLRRP
jgi:hypothetical protein